MLVEAYACDAIVASLVMTLTAGRRRRAFDDRGSDWPIDGDGVFRR